MATSSDKKPDPAPEKPDAEDTKKKPAPAAPQRSTFEKVVEILHHLSGSNAGGGDEMADSLFKRTQKKREEDAGV